MLENFDYMRFHATVDITRRIVIVVFSGEICTVGLHSHAGVNIAVSLSIVMKINVSFSGLSNNGTAKVLNDFGRTSEGIEI